MSRKERKKTVPNGRVPKEEVVRAVVEKAEKGCIACAAAHTIASELGEGPGEVGFAADLKEISIVKCQLGLFGYGSHGRTVKPASEVTPALRQAIESSLVNGRLTCADAWRIADASGIPRMGVASACEAMKVKISSCQLGAF
jgi:hypothetical protein